MVRTTANPPPQVERVAIFQRLSGLCRSRSESNLHRRFVAAEECVQALGEKLRKNLSQLEKADQELRTLYEENEKLDKKRLRVFLIGGLALGIWLTVSISWIFRKTFGP